MSPNAVHAVIHAFGATVEIAFNSQCGKLIRDHADRPAGLISLTTVAISEDLGRGLGFIAGTKRAKAALDDYGVPSEIARSTGSVGGNDDPTSCNRVLP
jgi:hypothetical protein